MPFKLYLVCFVVALVGMALQTVLKLKSLQDKARAGNIKFSTLDYFKNDWLSISASVLTIILFLICLDNFLHWKPAIVDYVKIGFAFVGYVGSDIASRLFSVVNRKINSIIDTKTDTADGIQEKTLTQLTVPKGLPDFSYTPPPPEITNNKIE